MFARERVLNIAFDREALRGAVFPGGRLQRSGETRNIPSLDNKSLETITRLVNDACMRMSGRDLSYVSPLSCFGLGLVFIAAARYATHEEAEKKAPLT